MAFLYKVILIYITFPLQNSSSKAEPAHPVLFSFAAMHIRERSRNPPPQVTEQDDHSIHNDQAGQG